MLRITVESGTCPVHMLLKIPSAGAVASRSGNASINIECSKIDSPVLANLAQPHHVSLQIDEDMIERVIVEGIDNGTAELPNHRRLRIRLKRHALPHESSESSRKLKRPG